ncbi:hypothetical protein DAPPUDRAFT_239097 [Daphnia pulex]|uniref:Uncharacterized protein n=1 Tax=Daphnia pulex TaxID=6669 RepID=E9G8B9_DAPPU|nr:hypothetical protein DAPPUDRAFT_239097 [Daphnia pulex]|eukprot:EFX84301.1 hypothetical protein DAPPUDRAFT_239097 [Daphnia pulex]
MFWTYRQQNSQCQPLEGNNVTDNNFHITKDNYVVKFLRFVRVSSSAINPVLKVDSTIESHVDSRSILINHVLFALVVALKNAASPHKENRNRIEIYVWRWNHEETMTESLRWRNKGSNGAGENGRNGVNIVSLLHSSSKIHFDFISCLLLPKRFRLALRSVLDM